MPKITDIFNNKTVRKQKRMLDIKYGKAQKLVEELELEGKKDILAKLQAGYVKAVKGLYANLDPAKPIKDEPAAPKKAAKKKAPAKKAAKKKAPKADETDTSDLTN